MSFSPKTIDNFLRKSKLNFWTKNEDFEQCASEVYSKINGMLENGTIGADDCTDKAIE